MRKLLYAIPTKIAVTVMSVLVQLIILLAMFNFLNEYFSWFYGIMLLLSVLAVAFILVQDNKPEYKMAWIILAFVFPVFGGIIYLMFWRTLFTKKQLDHYEKVSDVYLEAMDTQGNIVEQLKKEDKRAYRQSNYIRNTSGGALYQGTETTYLRLGEEMLEVMVEELKKAERFIFFEYFIIEDGKMWRTILEVLEQKAQQGVDVRVMYDDFGCMMTLPSDFMQSLHRKGIACHPFNKFSHIFNARFNNRNHRKICVIDGNVGFTGGINIADEYINAYAKHGHWKDTAIMLKGEAVYGLTAMFLSIWHADTETIEDYTQFKPTKSYATDGYVQPFTDTPMDDEPVGERLYMSLLNQAERYVYITTPYLIISNDMITAFQTAVQSGIDVRIILPGIADKQFVHFLSRSYYEVLIKAGVKIYEYTPGFIHAKMFVSDDDTAVIGTINLDYRSLALHYECATWLYQTKTVHAIKADFLQTLEQCQEMTMDKILGKNKMGLWKFIMLSILRVFAPLM